MMIKCPKCKSDIEADSLFCDQCGDELRICPKCKKLGRGKRCTQCGMELLSVSEIAYSEKNTVWLVNHVLGIRLEMVDGGIIGRKEGEYVSTFAVHSYVSGRHARLAYDKDKSAWCIMDLDSTNGTYVNKAKLEAEIPCYLKKGDRVKIATIEFIVE